MAIKTITISRETFQGLLEGIAYGGHNNNSRLDMFHRMLGEPWETVTMCEADARLLLCGFSYVNEHREKLLAALRRAEEKPGFYNCTAEPAKTGIVIKPADPLAHACFTCGKPTVRDKMICEECCDKPSPVPPAGVEVEVLSYLYRHPTGEPWPRTYKDRQYGMTDWVETELVDRAHVTRLQAEVFEVRTALQVANKNTKQIMAQRDALQAELAACQQQLTKARESLAETRSALEGMVEYFPEGHSDGECFSVEKAKAVLSNQSAPADKGQL